MIRIYYEKDMHEQILTSIDASRHYLKSEKLISDEQKEVHYEFLKNISLLSNIKLEQNKKKKDVELMAVEKSIKNMQSNLMSVKNWLLEKVNLLK